MLFREDEWSQTQTQTMEPGITEGDLEIIRERETNIRQLEVRHILHCHTEYIYITLWNLLSNGSRWKKAHLMFLFTWTTMQF